MTLALGFTLSNYILYSLGIIALWVSEALNPAVVILSLLLLSILFAAEIREKIPVIKGKNYYGFYFGPLTVVFLYFKCHYLEPCNIYKIVSRQVLSFFGMSYAM